MIDTFTLPMRALGGRERTIRVLLPPLVAGRRYPVLYMHDGQNLFRDEEATYGTCWRVAEALADLGMQLIVVGIDSNPVGHGRLDELSPWVNDWIQRKLATYAIDRAVGGEGDGYLDFLVGELKPFIDQRYPTQPDRDSTFLAGSSMGGLASLYGACRHPEVFSRAACLSSAFWFAQQPLVDYLATARLPDRVYLDVGTAEGSRQNNEEERLAYINDTRQVAELLWARMPPGAVKVVVDEGGLHNEAAWSRRLPAALKWWLPELVRG